MISGNKREHEKQAMVLLEVMTEGNAELLEREALALTQDAKSVLTSRLDGLLAALRKQDENEDIPHPSSGLEDGVKLGDTIGSYKVREKLGEGGMGDVYLAGRTDDLDQKVALKVLSHFQPKMRALFERECKILSGLRHPHIAYLIDAGLTGDVRPWLAMEYVEGQNLDIYLSAHNPDLKTRLALFLKICDGLSHAHGQMVIHRDLKPGNIIITPTGEPKLLDFGIASSLDPDTGEQQTVTLLAERMMTPEYASPEQVNGLRLSAASDVYSLGVLLYEMLTGKRPIRFKSRNPMDMIKAVNSTTISRPSTVSQYEGRTMGAFSRHLRGDLDTIVLKAMERDKTRRYASVEALAGDLRLHLAGQPIRARPATASYRLRKLVARHPWPFAVGAGLLVFLSFFAVYATWQKNLIRDERDRVHREKQTAESVTDFLVSMFEQVDPDLAKGGEVSAFDVLEIGRQQVAGSLREQPDVQIRLLATMGRVYRALGHYQPSLALFSQAVEKGGGPNKTVNALELIKTQQEAGELSDARAGLDLLAEEILAQEDANLKASFLLILGNQWLLKGRYVTADSIFDEILDLGAIDDDLLMELQTSRAELYLSWAYYDRAIEVLLELLAQKRQKHGETHSQVAKTLLSLGIAYAQKGEFSPAEEKFEEVESIYDKLLEKTHPKRIELHNSRGDNLSFQGDYSAAEDSYRQALSISRERLGDDHLKTAICLDNLSQVRLNMDDWKAAEKHGREALAIFGTIGKKHPGYALCLNTLGLVYQKNRDLDAAEPLLRQALTIMGESMGKGHPDFATCLNNIARLLVERDDLEAAEPLYRKAILVMRECLGKEHLKLGNALLNLAGLLIQKGNLEEAESLCHQILDIYRKNLMEKNPIHVTTLNNLAHLKLKKGDLEGAEPLYRKAVSLGRECFGERHPTYVLYLSNLAYLLGLKGDFKESCTVLGEAVSICREQLSENHQTLGQMNLRLATIMRDMGDYAAAELLFEEVLSIRRKNMGEKHLSVANNLFRLAKMLQKKGSLDSAENKYRQALSILRAELPAGHIKSLRVKTDLATLYFEENRLTEAQELISRVRPHAEEQKEEDVLAGLNHLEARMLFQQEKSGRAIDLLREVLATKTRLTNDTHPDLVPVLLDLAYFLARIGEADEAAQILERTTIICNYALLPTHEYHQVIASIKGLILVERGNPEGPALLKQAHEKLAKFLGSNHFLTRRALQNLETVQSR